MDLKSKGMAPREQGLHSGARWKQHGSLATRGPHGFVKKPEAGSSGGRNIWENH